MEQQMTCLTTPYERAAEHRRPILGVRFNVYWQKKSSSRVFHLLKQILCSVRFEIPLCELATVFLVSM